MRRPPKRLTGCKPTYYGETIRHLHIWVCEDAGVSHLMGKVTKSPEPSAVFEHNLDCPVNVRAVDYPFSDFTVCPRICDFSVLCSASSDFHLKIKEKLLISRDKPSQNRNIAPLPLLLFYIEHIGGGSHLPVLDQTATHQHNYCETLSIGVALTVKLRYSVVPALPSILRNSEIYAISKLKCTLYHVCLCHKKYAISKNTQCRNTLYRSLTVFLSVLADQRHDHSLIGHFAEVCSAKIQFQCLQRVRGSGRLCSVFLLNLLKWLIFLLFYYDRAPSKSVICRLCSGQKCLRNYALIIFLSKNSYWAVFFQDHWTRKLHSVSVDPCGLFGEFCWTVEQAKVLLVSVF